MDQDGNLIGNHAQIFCHKITTGNDYELDFYRSNMQSSISAMVTASQKTFVSSRIFGESQGTPDYDKVSAFYWSWTYVGDKILNNDPKDLLTCE